MKSWVFQSKDDAGGWVEQDSSALPDEPVHVRVTHSGLNYKDALSLTRTAPISKQFPMVPGIDLVGVVLSDASGTFQPGEKVVATGYGLGEKFWGAYSEEARLKPEWLVRLPAGLGEEQAAAVGTSGLTAAMCIDALERHGIRPDQGKVLVTGASGGVGSYATWLLNEAGYSVVAATGRKSEAAYLTEIGAAEILDRAELEGQPRPLGKERWRAAVDVAGGAVLANVLASIEYGGAVAACGLVASMALPTSVAPFILRGVSLLGVDSVMAGADTRARAWDRIARTASSFPFDRTTSVHPFSDVSRLAQALLAQELRGKAVLRW